MASRLCFIMGAPRSGTTALTRLLIGHPDVLHAGPDELGTRGHDLPTFESNVFLRVDDDAEIRRRFAALDGRRPLIVEKTPTHILHVARIRRVFPEARLLVTLRDAVPALTSIKVARSWMNTRRDLGSFATLWTRCTERALRRAGEPGVFVAPYDRFMADKPGVARALFGFLGLDPAPLERCLAAMDDPATERVKGVVGESVKGGTTRLDAEESAMVARVCGATQAKLTAFLDAEAAAG